MKIIADVKKMQSWTKKIHRQGKTIGFVPTMGYLHEGHLSLMRKARRECDYAVISIFVNPTQFGPKEDFKRYPRDFERDRKLAKRIGVNILFHPTPRQMYPKGYQTNVFVRDLGEVLCGQSRPGHFCGVSTVVLKLFNIVQPNIAYFGQKDAQQTMLIKKMVQDLDLPLKISVLPIIREKDGLAMSSRNRYLNKQQRKNAVILYKSLQTAVGMIQSGYKSPRKICSKMKKMIKDTKGARIDYIKIVDMETLAEVKKLQGQVLIALAVFFGKTRLIDNIILQI